MPSFTFNTTRQPKSGKRERLTVTAAETRITSTVYIVPNTNVREPVSASAAALQVITESIYWTIDGTVPTASIGFEAAAGDFIYLDSHQKVKEFRAIRTGVTNATVEVVALFGG